MGHRLGLATRTRINVCKSPFPSASTTVSLFCAKCDDNPSHSHVLCIMDCGLFPGNLSVSFHVSITKSVSPTYATGQTEPALVATVYCTCLYCRYCLLLTSRRMSFATTKWSPYFCLPSTCTATTFVQKICR